MNCELIKVCGMRDADNIREVESAIANSSKATGRPDSGNLFTLHSSLFLMGFIFWPKSSRYVSEKPTYLPTQCKRVGVFVDETIETVMRIADDYALDYIQLHGHESPDYIRALNVQWSMVNGQCSIIKSFNIATAQDFAQTAPYAGLVDYFLFDTRKSPREVGGWLPPGGTGQKFDWSVLSAYDGDTPFLLSGGIGPDDAEVLTSQLSPLTSKKCIGIDLNSRFETAPGLKNVNALSSFLRALIP